MPPADRSHPGGAPRALVHLARLTGIAPVHVGADRVVRAAGPDALLTMLRALDVPIERAAEAPVLLRARRAAHWRTPIEPVTVSWTDRRPVLPVRLPADHDGALRITLTDEAGGVQHVDWQPASSDVRGGSRSEGRRFLRFSAPLGDALDAGYHDVHVEGAPGGAQHATLIRAPRRCHRPVRRDTAVFVPLYALHSARRPDCADLTDWTRLAGWLGEQDVGLLGTLPLCAAFLEPPVEPSPYAPVSRLFWNEAYLDLDRLPEPPDTAAHTAPGESRLVDWLAVAAHRVDALQRAADRHFAEHGPDGAPALRAFAAARPDAADFARFRATQQRLGRNWRDWPAAARDGTLDASLADPAALRRHRYAQWQAAAQIDAALTTMRAADVEPYLDLPVGVHADGYDAWRHRDAFLGGCSAGAPPDAFFTLGQDWGFAPLHPARSRASGHRYFRACIRHQLRHCGVLRIDHVMGLHRIWTIPHDAPAQHGCYLRQPATELFAIVALESQRERCAVIGEDLGTVPPGTERALREHDIASMHVVQFAVSPRTVRTCLTPPAHTLAGLNTHDMPTFRAWWEALDVPDRVDLGLLDTAGASAERRRRRRLTTALCIWLQRRGRLPQDRTADTAAALRAILLELAASDTDVLVASLEDLWLEDTPQNVPGTTVERPNWRRRTMPTLDAILNDPGLARALRELTAARATSRQP